MILADTGPVIALLNADGQDHSRVTATLARLYAPMVTTCHCLTEAMYFLYKADGHQGQSKLWSLIETDALQIHPTTDDDRKRMKQMMEQYRDIPMDIADASLVAAAERLQEQRIFTLDKHFHAYRVAGKAFVCTP